MMIFMNINQPIQNLSTDPVFDIFLRTQLDLVHI